MATKSDLIEAQNFSRRRLLTAFVSGTPGGKELEPAAPLRAVVVAVALTAAVILAGVFYGILRPGLPNGWQNGKMVLAKDTGARYVTISGALHPVLNTASARLLIPSSDFAVITTDQKTLSDHKLGPAVGIVGAPDELPARSALVNTGWTACPTGSGGTDVEVQPHARNRIVAAPAAAVVANNGVRYVIEGNHRFAIDTGESDAVLRAAGFTSLDPITVSTPWLNLFSPGTKLAPIVVDNAGLPLTGTDLTIGEVVHPAGSPTDQRFVVRSDGTLAALTPLDWSLLQLGSGRQASRVVEVAPSTIAGLPTSKAPVGGSDWPAKSFAQFAPGQNPCAVLTRSGGMAQTVLGTAPADTTTTNAVHVAPGHGALIYAGNTAKMGSGMLTLIDSTGTAYALPGATEETIRRLGYVPTDAGAAPDSWIRLFASGPALSTAAAGKTHATAGSK